MAGGGWRTTVRSWTQLTGGVVTLLAADHVCQAACTAAGIRFPPALLGMFVLLGGMALCEDAGEQLCDWFAPALQWIQRWMALFYAPFLVALPANAVSLIGPQLPQILLLLAGGVALSMASTGQVVQLVQRRWSSQPGRKGEDAEEAPALQLPRSLSQDFNAVAAAPPAKHASYGTTAAAWGLITLGGFAALAAAPRSPQAAECAAAFMLGATVLSYIAGAVLPQKVHNYVHPVIFCGVGANAAAAALGAVQQQPHAEVLRSYMSKGGGGAWLLKFLGVIILSFGFRLFERRRLIWRHAAAILGGVAFAVVSSLFVTALAARLLQLPPEVARAVVPRSVTAALALPIAASLDAPLPVTAAAVVCTGTLGAAMARLLLDRTGCSEPLARGVAAASAAHGMATAALGSAEPEALPFAALAYALAGIMATLLCALSPVRWLLLSITG